VNELAWVDGANVDDELVATRDDETLTWDIRVLAAASIGMDPAQGHAAVCELSDAIDGVVRNEQSGRAALAAILGRDVCDYQRCLWYTLAGRHPLAVATYIKELRQLMAGRAEMWLTAERKRKNPVKEPNPYQTDRAEGPLGHFDSDFRLGSHWEAYLPD
jgi:hypothetical protein